MGYTNLQRAAAWQLVRAQHGVVARWQLLGIGYGAQAIKHRMGTGRLYPLWRGVYAVCLPAMLAREGWWMGAVLACGSGAVLSHSSAAALWRITDSTGPEIHVSVVADARRGRPGIVVHRRAAVERDYWDGIPVTSIVVTLIDLAAGSSLARRERAINEADRLDLIDPESLRSSLDGCSRRPGLAILRRALDRRTFRLTDSFLERLFLPIVRAAGLPEPETGRRLNGFKVDFFWPDLGLVVETDGLRYHRTAAQQSRDRLRDQAHVATGLTPLRFTHAQVRFEPDNVRAILVAVAKRLNAKRLSI